MFKNNTGKIKITFYCLQSYFTVASHFFLLITCLCFKSVQQNAYFFAPSFFSGKDCGKHSPWLSGQYKHLWDFDRQRSEFHCLILKYFKFICVKYFVNNYSTCVSGGDLEPPTAILWVYHFLAQHFDHLRDSKRAMEYIEKALEHTPTLIEAYMVKARIYKVMGTKLHILLLKFLLNLD